MVPAPPPWFAVVLRRTKRLVRGALRRFNGRQPGKPPALVGPQLARTGLHRYGDYQQAGADAPLAALTAARDVLERGNLAGALRLGYTLAKVPVTAEVGRAVLGLAHLSSSAPEQAWDEFAVLTRLDVIAAASPEYFVAGFAVARDDATETATTLVRQLGWPELGARTGLDIARHAFSVGREDVAREYLAALQDGRLGEVTAGVDRAAAEFATWLSDGERRAEAEQPPAGFRFGLLEFKQPAHRSPNLGDYTQTLAAAGLIARHTGLQFVGDPDLVDVVKELAGRVRTELQVPSPPTTVHLVEVLQEASTLQALPEPTWAFLYGWYQHRTFSADPGLRLNPALRPIFLSFHLAEPEALTQHAVEYLRRYGPVGCRDWQTVALLRTAGVPAFFSGCLSTTVDTAFPRPDRARSGTVFVDPADPGRVPDGAPLRHQDRQQLRTATLAAGLRLAAADVAAYGTDYSEVVTSRLHSYLAARAFGCRVRFEPANRSDVSYGGLLELDDAAFDAMREGLLAKSSAVLGWLADGAGEDEVYSRWRQLCARDVAEAERFLDDFELRPHALPQPSPPAPLASRLVVVDAPYRSERGVQELLSSLAEHAPQTAVVVVGPGGEHSDTVRWIRDLPVPERGSAQQQQALMLASVLDSLPAGVRVLLLPSDAVVRGPLDGLFDLDLGGHALAAREDIRDGHQEISVVIRRVASRQAYDWRGALRFLAAAHARCGHGGTTFDSRVAVIDPVALAEAGFGEVARELIDEYGASLNETLNIVLKGHFARLQPTDHSNVALERPAPGATVISGLSQARMGAHWFE